MTRRPILSAPLIALMCVAGVGHFVLADDFASIVPPMLPEPHIVVYVTGVMELILGLGLLFERSRKLFAYANAVFLVLVLPANIYMAVADIPAFGTDPDSVMPWVRLPFQTVLIAWALLIARDPAERE